MQIGFDAKRIFKNTTGLGNYSRSLVASLSHYFPEEQYTLFTATTSSLFDTTVAPGIKLVQPSAWIDRQLPAVWRRSRIIKDIRRSGVDIYHGLSNELPAGISRSGARSVVTIHDLIFERYPETYPLDQRYSHRWKMKSACKEADIIIAASRQTMQDLIDFYQVPADKIKVCYQHCNPVFEKELTKEELLQIKAKYQLPAAYFLFVSSITKRKNLLLICKAMVQLKGIVDIPLVVIGNGKKEKEEVMSFMQQQQLEHQLIFLNDTIAAQSEGFKTSRDFPGIYQQALALIYPSVFEGFGIPLLEALWSRLPVLSANTSSLPEVAGDAALYFDPADAEALAHQMKKISTDTDLRTSMIKNGLERTTHFTAATHAAAVMNVYRDLLKQG